MEVFLHDHMIVQRSDTPSYYEIDLAIREIPSSDEYDDTRLLVKCADVRTPIMERNLSADEAIAPGHVEIGRARERKPTESRISSCSWSGRFARRKRITC